MNSAALQQPEKLPPTGHVLMLVNNPCVNDSRVIKSAEALANGGRMVTILCRHIDGVPEEETRNGVTYQRIKPIPMSVGSLKHRLAAFICRPALGSLKAWSLRRWLEGRKIYFKQLHHRARAYLRLSRRKLRSGGIHGVVLALAVLALGSVAFSRLLCRRLRRPFVVYGKPLLRRLRRPFVVYGKPLLRRLRRPFVVYGKPLLRRLRRPFIIHGKPLLRRARRAYILHIKPFLVLAYWFFETDEFGSAAVSYAKSLQPDVVHAHDLATLPAGGRIARAVGARLIYDSHELEMHRNAVYTRPVKWRRQRLESKYIRKTDAVITVSESIADHLRDVYRIPRPHVIMNAPLFDEMAEPERHVRADLGMDEEVPLAVYVGSVTINRGLEQTVRSLAYADGLHFATVGPRRPATEQVLIEIAQESNVLDRIHFIDPVAPNEVVGYIRSADVSVLAIQNVCLSYYYCMPNKLLESVFAGVPVAVADLLEMRRFVETHSCGVIMDETDPEAIAEAIMKVLNGRNDFILSAKMRKRLAEQYGWPKQAQDLRALYEDLIGSREWTVKAA